MIISAKLEEHVRKDGKSKVYIYLYDSSTRQKARVPTIYYVHPDHWTGKEVDRKNPHASYINPKIKQIVLDLENYVLKHPGITAEELKRHHEKEEPDTFSPVEYFRHYIKLCKEGIVVKKATREKMTTGYLKAVGTSAAHLEKYCKTHKVGWGDFSEPFFDRYVNFLRNLGYKQNYIAKSIGHLIMIVDHARTKGKLHTNDDTTYHIQLEKVQKIRLTPEEVQRMIDLDLREWPDLQEEQERFQVAYNLLLRFGDSIEIKEQNITHREGKYYLSAVTQKTRKPILLPIKSTVYKILKKHKFKLQGINSKSNQKLKRIGMMARVNDLITVTEFRAGKKTTTQRKKWELIETHTTRRSAARNLFDSGMAPEIIMTLGGWSTMKQLLDYIDIDLDYAASKAAEHPFFD